MPINQMSGIHTDWPQLVAQLSFTTVKDYDDWIARLHAIPLGGLASCFTDGRNQEMVEHPLGEMLAQRLSGWRWVMRTSTITNSYAAIRCWRCSAASAIWMNRWRARAR